MHQEDNCQKCWRIVGGNLERGRQLLLVSLQVAGDYNCMQNMGQYSHRLLADCRQTLQVPLSLVDSRRGGW